MTNAIFLTVLVLLAAYDVKTHRLSNVIMFPLIVVCTLLTGYWAYTLSGLVIGLLFYVDTPFEHHIAEGDVKLFVLFGAMFGAIGIFGIICGFTLAAFIRLLTREYRPMAFTPFAALAVSICILSDQALSGIVR